MTLCMNHSAGITVIELLITLAVLSIVIALGVPSIADWVRRMEVRSSAESLSDTPDLPERLLDDLKQRFLEAQFLPGRLNNQPVPSQMRIRIRLE